MILTDKENALLKEHEKIDLAAQYLLLCAAKRNDWKLRVK